MHCQYTSCFSPGSTRASSCTAAQRWSPCLRAAPGSRGQRQLLLQMTAGLPREGKGRGHRGASGCVEQARALTDEGHEALTITHGCSVQRQGNQSSQSHLAARNPYSTLTRQQGDNRSQGLHAGQWVAGPCQVAYPGLINGTDVRVISCASSSAMRKRRPRQGRSFRSRSEHVAPSLSPPACLKSGSWQSVPQASARPSSPWPLCPLTGNNFTAPGFSQQPPWPLRPAAAHSRFLLMLCNIKQANPGSWLLLGREPAATCASEGSRTAGEGTWFSQGILAGWVS